MHINITAAWAVCYINSCVFDPRTVPNGAPRDGIPFAVVILQFGLTSNHIVVIIFGHACGLWPDASLVATDQHAITCRHQGQIGNPKLPGDQESHRTQDKALGHRTGAQDKGRAGRRPMAHDVCPMSYGL